MDKFPSEILHDIFIRLELKQRLVCTLVCRWWWQVLDKSSLFHSIQVAERSPRFNHFMNHFEQWPHRAAQVEELHFSTMGDHLFHRNILLKMFPNIREMITVGECAMKSHKFRYFGSRHDISKSNIEVLSDVAHCELLYQILDSNLGGRLNTLYLDFNFVTGPHSILCQLKGLPVLKKLHLVSPEINLYDLEAMHQSVPTIQDFLLRSMKLEATSMPPNIVPATAITKFKFSNCRFQRVASHIQFYQYIAKKYINITDGEYVDKGLCEHVNGAKQIYTDGILALFKVVGQRQNKLDLYGLPNDVDPFAILDAVNSQIKRLSLYSCASTTVFQNLSQSQQFNHIETLVVDGLLLDSLYLIKSMPVLTTLKLNIYTPQLVDCLDACPPSLKNFSFEIFTVSIPSFNDKVYSIENLDIQLTTAYGIPGELGDLISSCFPNLMKLNIKGNVTENINITLKNPHLQEANFITTDDHKKYNTQHAFSFTSPNQTETKFYIYNETKKIYMQCDDIPDLPLLSVVSYTEMQIMINKDIRLFS